MFKIEIEGATVVSLIKSLQSHIDALGVTVTVLQETAPASETHTDTVDPTPEPEKVEKAAKPRKSRAKRPPKAKSNGNGEAKDEPAPTPEALNELARQYAIEHGADTVHELLEKAGASRLTLLTEQGRIKMHALLTAGAK